MTTGGVIVYTRSAIALGLPDGSIAIARSVSELVIATCALATGVI